MFVNVVERAGGSNKTDLRDLLHTYICKASEAIEKREAARLGMDVRSATWRRSEEGRRYSGHTGNLWLISPKSVSDYYLKEMCDQVQSSRRPHFHNHRHRRWRVKDREAVERFMMKVRGRGGWD